MPKKEVEMAGKLDKQDPSRTRGGRLARRARSFKEDLLEKITQMRSPSAARSSSPSKASPRAKHKGSQITMAASEGPPKKKNSERDMTQLQKDVNFALRYFQDVVDKNILEMLPGSATVVLESVLAIHSLLKNSLTNEQSSLLMSTTNQVYQSLANLIRWSDNILLHGEKAQNKENVSEIVKAVQDAIKTLVQLAVGKLQNKEIKVPAINTSVHNGICSVASESPKRTSLPDIPLTPRELEILEQTSFVAHDDSQLELGTSSLSNISGINGSMNADDEIPPPKPPLPSHWESYSRYPSTGCVSEIIPPLPPKRRIPTMLDPSGSSVISWNENFPSSPHADLTPDWSSQSLRKNSSDWTSPGSISPDSESPLSFSASSLDSVLNRSSDDLNAGVSNISFQQGSSSTVNKISSSSEHYFEYMSSSTSHKTGVIGSGSRGDDLLQLQRKLNALCEKPQSLSSSGVYSGTSSSTVSIQSCSTVNSTASHSANTSTPNKITTITKTVMHNSSCSESSSTWTSSDASLSQGFSDPVFTSPPAIPPKKRTTRIRTPSQYDNVPDLIFPNSEEEHSESASPVPQHHMFEYLSTEDENKPPPLPPKKKHIMAYMQMIGTYSEPSKSEFLRHSVHTYNLLQAQWQQHEMTSYHLRSVGTSISHLSSSDESSVFSESLSFNLDRSATEDDQSMSPPALPPKRNRSSTGGMKSRPNTSPSEFPVLVYETREKSSSAIEGTNGHEAKEYKTGICDTQVPSEPNKVESKKKVETPEDLREINPLDELDVESFLVHKKVGEEGPDIRGGSVEALIIRATKVNKNDFMYQEAFLTTYRTFIQPLDLIKKLLYRYNKFSIMTDLNRQRAARNAFALLVRVVDDLCVNDIDDFTMQTLMDFVFHLLCNGDLTLARALRKKILEKCEAKKRANANNPILLPAIEVTTRQSTLLDFKSEQLAEQMTLLDADLFLKIEIPEVLIWAREQSEELSPNLTTFTEHFNKMSYWARSRILERDDAKDRERYVVKFIKIMKYLRRLNNFNSYLAILSALDSAPIRRLEWQKHITEGLKEYCELIDSSSSFRAYRQALAETEPPCIPYIGLILQDLTFVHIGNSDVLADGNVNFSKRWQQFNILDNMRRFKTCNYSFKRNDRIIAFFNNFDDCLCEEAMWQISESIKPRGGKKKSDQS